MTLQEIRVSGLLEQYAVGATSDEEDKIVLQAISDFPQLKEDLDSIHSILKSYNALDLIDPPQELKQKVIYGMSQIEPDRGVKRNIIHQKKSKDSKKPSQAVIIPWIPILSTLVGLLAISTIGTIFFKNGQVKKLDDKIVSLSNNLDQEKAKYQVAKASIDSLSMLSDPNNALYSLKPSLRYSNTSMYIVKSVQDGRYYSKITSLPALPPGRKFKLWAITNEGVFVHLDIALESLSDQFLNPIDIPSGTQSVVLAIHREANEAPPTRSLIMGTISLE